MTADRGWLLMRHGGALWGIDNAAVESLTRDRGGFRIGLAPTEIAETAETAGSARATHLWIDEIVGVVADLEVRPLVAGLRRFWPAGADGLAVHGALPVVVVDPRRPPGLLHAPQREGGVGQGDGRDG
jgi:hypothetical protein